MHIDSKKKEINFLKKEIRQVFEGKASKGLSSSVVVIAVHCYMKHVSILTRRGLPLYCLPLNNNNLLYLTCEVM